MRRFVLSAVTLLCLISCLLPGCTTNTPITEPTEPLSTPVDATALYASATEALASSASVSMSIFSRSSVAVGSDIYSGQSAQKLTILNQGSEDTRIISEEFSFHGQTGISIEEIYMDSMGYFSIDDNHFKSEMTAQEFLQRYAPVVILDPALYTDITAHSENDTTYITFDGATAAEAWLHLENITLDSASGTACIKQNGQLRSCSYTLKYTYAGMHHYQSCYIYYNDAATEDIAVPAGADAYTLLEYPDLPRLLESAYGLLLQSNTVTTHTAQTYLSQAAGVYYSSNSFINTARDENQDLLARLENSIYIYDYTRNSTTEHEQTELFKDGVYSISTNGEEPVENRFIKEDDVWEYTMQALTENIVMSKYLKNATAVDLGSLYLFEFEGTEEMAQSIRDHCCELLFSDADLLNDMAQAYKTTKIDCYLAFDKYSGLPTAVGIHYTGYHTVDGVDYELACQWDQSFVLGSLSAKEAILDTAPDVPNDVVQPTPLFYHVTGQSGEELWLFGTIHVGDIRTSALPQEIYDALDAADALAVEFDPQSFDEKAEQDKALRDAISKAYTYSDGTTLDKHIDSELYEYSIALTKAIGAYSQNTNHFKPFVLESEISNYFLRQSYTLTSENGMDNRLLARARDAEKEILDVESGLFQINMLSGYTDATQEMLLLATVASDPYEHWTGVNELYQLWCEGDEEEIRQALITDTSEMTQEEKKLYSEYNEAMMIQRNDGMLAFAKEQLLSGKKVFMAVGLAHLLCDNGLVDTLRQAGYRVELVTYDASATASDSANEQS